MRSRCGESEPQTCRSVRRRTPHCRERREHLGAGCARIRVELEHRGVQLGLRAARKIAPPLQSRNESGALPDLLERLGVEHGELLLDAQRQRRRPLAEPRLGDHYCARTPWTGRPAAIHA